MALLLFGGVAECNGDGFNVGKDGVASVKQLSGDANVGAVKHPGVRRHGRHPFVEQIGAGADAVITGGVGAALQGVGLAVDQAFGDMDAPVAVQPFAIGNTDGAERHPVCQAFFHLFGGGMKKNSFCLCQAGAENISSRIICLIRSSRLVLFFVLNCRKMGYVPLPMVRTSVGFSAAFGSSTTGGLFTLVNEASFPHSWCIDLIAGIWRNE